MRDAIAKLVEFHRAVDQWVGDPSAPHLHERALRVALIKEELLELIDALKDEDMVGVADALADLSYVVIGSAVTWGIPLAEVFDEVHRSNMTKAGAPRRPDGKILKGPNYSPPNIAHVLAVAKGTIP